MAKRYVKKNKPKLSREQQRQRAAARMAKKRAEEPAYRANEQRQRDAAGKAKKRAEDPAYRANEAAKDAASKAQKRQNTTYKDEENKRNNKRKKTARKTKRQRKAANPKGYINNEIIQLITHWKDCEAGSGDLRHRNDKG